MSNFSRIRLNSSWNSDRVGSCIANRPHKVRQPRKTYCFAQYSGKEASVCGSRGKKRFTVAFDAEVVSAIIREGMLVVETADACVRTYEAGSGRLVSETRPTPPSDRLTGAVLQVAA